MSDIRTIYNQDLPSEAEILHGLNLQVQHGEFVALMGPSGSGKSFAQHDGLLEHLTAGNYLLQGEEVKGLNDSELTLLRSSSTIVFVFQFTIYCLPLPR